MSVSILDREQQQNTQFNRPVMRDGYVSLYAQQEQRQAAPVQNMTPNRLPSYQPQNDYYMNQQSDNINMHANPYDMYQMVQQNANYYAQSNYAPYYNDQQYYNNVSANVETHPTNMYQQAQVQQNDYMYYGYSAPQMGQVVPENNGYEKTIPQKSKAKNKTTKALIAVYFLIVAICAALIIVNVVAAASAATATAATVETGAYNAESVYYTVDESGNVTQMEKTAQVVDYKYDTSTNWFDKMCDKIGKLLG